MKNKIAGRRAPSWIGWVVIAMAVGCQQTGPKGSVTKPASIENHPPLSNPIESGAPSVSGIPVVRRVDYRNDGRSESRGSGRDGDRITSIAAWVDSEGQENGENREFARVTDAFIETDLRMAIESIAAQASEVVVVDQGVQGLVTATFDHVPFPDAINRLIAPHGLVHRTVGMLTYVGLPDPESPLFSKLAIRKQYATRHQPPERLVERLGTRLSTYVTAAAESGLIHIHAPTSIAEEIVETFIQFDVGIPQVELETLICVYAPETSFRFGFDMQQGVTLRGSDTAQLSMNGLNLSGRYGGAGLDANLNDFGVTTAVLRQMEQEGFLNIQASPSVITEHGKKAMIHIGRESFFSLQPSNNGLLLRQDVQRVESGIILELTPTIRGRQVTIDIQRAEVSEDIRVNETQTGQNNQFPVINRRRVSTTVHLLDGQTMMLGGLTQKQTVEQFNQIPVLGDLPVVGRLFQRVEDAEYQADVSIFVSPRIVPPESMGAAR